MATISGWPTFETVFFLVLRIHLIKLDTVFTCNMIFMYKKLGTKIKFDVNCIYV